MQELQENKEFIQLVSDHDIHTMIKAIRNVMGVAKIRKEEKSSKRKTGDAKRTASSKFDADTLSQLDAMMANSKAFRSEEHTSELQSLMRISYAVFCLKK